MQDLKIISREHMEKDKFYHDFAHAMGVYKNVQKLLEHEQGDEVSLSPGQRSVRGQHTLQWLAT